MQFLSFWLNLKLCLIKFFVIMIITCIMHQFNRLLLVWLNICRLFNFWGWEKKAGRKSSDSCIRAVPLDFSLRYSAWLISVLLLMFRHKCTWKHQHKCILAHVDDVRKFQQTFDFCQNGALLRESVTYQALSAWKSDAWSTEVYCWNFS